MKSLSEKYRPTTFDDFVGQKHVVSYLKGKIEAGEPLPHLLFSGPTPGTGKTTLAYIIARTLGCDMIEKNASDERGIDAVRNSIKTSATTSTLKMGRKIIFLDEGDGLTPDAQQALRRIMEKNEQTTMFIIACNYKNKIIEPIESRCTPFQFYNLTPAEIRAQIVRINEFEALGVAPTVITSIINGSNGSLRNAIKLLDMGHYSPAAVEDCQTSYTVFASTYQSLKRPGSVDRVAKDATFKVYKSSLHTFITSLLYHVKDDKTLSRKIQWKCIDKLGQYYLASNENLPVEQTVDFICTTISKLIQPVPKKDVK